MAFTLFQPTVVPNTDSSGSNVVVGAAIEIRLQSNNNLANIFSDEGITPIANPGVTDANGQFTFYAESGVSLVAVSNGQTSPLGEDAASLVTIQTDTITEATPDNGVNIETVNIKDGLVDGRDVAADGAVLDVLAASVTVATATDPVTNAATTTAIVDANKGTVITLTTTSNSQTIAAPTDTTAGKTFFVVNDNASTDVINVNDRTIQLGEAVSFVWDGAAWANDPLGNSILSQQSTVLVSGCVPSINADTTKFDISSGVYCIFDAHTNPSKVFAHIVNYAGVTAQTTTNLATQDITALGLDENQNIIQQATMFEREDIRHYAVIGSLGHPNRTTITTVSRFTTCPAINIAASLYDLSNIFGTVNYKGSFKGSANGANLNVDLSAGTQYRMGLDPDTLEDQNFLDVAGQPNLSWIYGWTTTDGSGFKNIFSQTAIIPGSYDDGTAVQADALPQGTVGNNEFAIHHLYYEASSNVAAIQFGRNTYPSIADAIGGEANDLGTSENPSLEGFMLVSYIIVKGNATALNNAAQAEFRDGPFIRGSIGGGTTAGTTTLQKAYDNSTQPQILVDDTNGAFQVQSGRASDDDAVFETLNIAGTITGMINGNGCLQMTGVDVIHTATGSDDHALEVDVFASGFGDVKAFDVVYNTGAIATGQDEAIMLVNVDESLSTGGSVSGYTITTTTTGGASVYGMTTGSGVDAIKQLSGTFGDVDSILSNVTDVTVNLSSGGSGNITVFATDNDTMTYGSAAKYEQIEIVLDTPASQNINPIIEFSTGVGTWTTFTPVDGTNGFRNTGNIIWSDADIPTWAVGTGSEYLIRITRTRNNLTTDPIVDLVQISAVTEYTWDKDGNVSIKTLAVDGRASQTGLGGSTFFGFEAGLNDDLSSNLNAAFGYQALYSNTTGSNNTANGYQAGRFITGGSTANETSGTSVYLGSETKASADGNANEVVIGYNTTGNGSNTVTLGNDSITDTILKGNVGIGTSSPDNLLTVHSAGNTAVQYSSANIGSIGSEISQTYGFTGTTYQKGAVYFKSTSGNAVGDMIFALNSAENSSNVTSSDNVLTLVGSTGNVGIGTASPSTTLHADGPIRCKSYTVATVPSASASGAGSRIYVTDETGGSVDATSDGTDWRRSTDRAIIA